MSQRRPALRFAASVIGWRGLAGLLLAGVWALASAVPAALTVDEREWMGGHRTGVTVGVIEIPPLVMRDAAKTGFEGLAIDFLRQFERSLGIKTEIVRYPDWKSLLDAARNQQVDLVLTAVNTPDRRAFLNFSPSYMTLRNVIIARQAEVDGEVDLSMLTGKRVAVLEASAVHERIVKEYPGIRVYPLRDERTLLTAVAFHEADFAVTELSRAVWWMQHERLSSLRVVGQTPFDYALSVAVRKDWPAMVSSLEKAVLALPADENTAIMRRWAYLDADSWIERSGFFRTVVVVTAVLVAVLVIGAIVLLRRKVLAGTAEVQRQLEQAEAMRLRLADSERKFRELAELTSDIFWETNDRLVFVRYYGGGTSLVGVRESEMQGKAWWDLNQPGIDTAAFDQIRLWMEQRQSFRRWICRMVDAGGGRRWLSLSGQAAYSADGEFVGYQGTGQDVTDRMQQQERLTEVLERMQAVQDGTYSFLGLLSPDGTTLECNRAALEFSDRQKSDVIGRPYWEMPWWQFDEEVERVRSAIVEAANGEFVRFDARVVDTARVTHWIDFSLSPYYDEHGELIYLVPEAHDITEAKGASTALDSLMSSTGAVYGEAFFRNVVEAMGRLLAVKYVFIGRLTGQMARVRTVAVWAGDAVAENIEYALKATPCDKVMQFGCCVYPRDVQSLFPDDLLLKQMGVESYAGVPVIGIAGQPIGVLVVLHDKPLSDTGNLRRLMELFSLRAATEFERLDYEEEIHALNTGLEARVAERTEALQQVNRELEAFSYSVSHDLRAPLRHISGFVEMLVEQDGAVLSVEGRRHLDVIRQSASRMGVMIDDLLAFSRAGRSEVRKTRLSLMQLVSESIRQMEQDLVGRYIEWKIGELPEVSADRGLISLVLANLIGNAVKYSRLRNPAVIEIGSDDAKGSASEQVIFIRDNGIGFDMQYVHKLFGVFQRLHNDSEYEGTGIGLANVRRIVERHGGRVWAESVPNHGSTFYFTLPALMRPGQSTELVA